MLNHFIAARFRISLTQGRKLVKILLLAVSVMAFSVLGLVIGSSLFLNNAGTDYLPLSYILMGLFSLPVYTWLSQVVDQISRTKLSRYLLLAGILIVTLLRLCLAWDSLAIYYIIHIGCYLQWILTTEVLFPSLVADYFTSLDWKKYTSFIRMAMAMGGLLGGGLASLLAQKITTENMLLSLPLIYGIVLGQVIYLENSERPLDNISHEEEQLTDFKTFYKLIKQYPIIFFLASSTFLFIVLYTLAEFLYFTVYIQSFSEQSLTSFLGIMRIVNNLIPFVVLYLVTQPLIEKLGVIKMNLAYPLTSLISFLALVLNFNLVAAIFTNINTDGLDDSLHQPIHNLNYNAVPHHLIGRVRTISTGLFYSIGLAFSGIILWIAKSIFTPWQITFMAILLSLIFVVIHYFLGKSYLTSLLAMLKAGSVKITDVSEGLNNLPLEYSKQIYQLLISQDRQDQILGLELGARVEFPVQFLTQVELLLKREDPALNQALVNFFSHSNYLEINRYLRFQLGSKNEYRRMIALESLIAGNNHLSDQEIFDLTESFNSQIKALACLAALEAGTNDQKIKNTCDQVWQSDLNTATRLAVIRGIRSTKDRQLIPLLQTMLIDASTQVKREGLDALASLAKPGDFQLEELAAKELTHLDNLVRAAAFQLMGVICSPRLLLDVAVGLENPNMAVRLWATSALSKYGEASLGVAKIYLFSPRLEVVEASIAVIGKVGTRRASDILYHFLKPDFQLFLQTQVWLQQIPENSHYWRQFKLIITDYHQRLLHRVLYVISCLDHQGTFANIKNILHAKDRRLRANAIETLASFEHRRFIVPILPLLENLEKHSEPVQTNNNLSPKEILKEASHAKDHWIRLGALFIISHEKQPIPQCFETLLDDLDPLVQRVAQSLFNKQQDNFPESDWFLNQVLFLKTTPLLKSLFLDELLVINAIFNQQDFPEGSVICSETKGIKELYIIYQGRLTLIDDSSKKITLHRGQHFGDITLFDNTPVKIKVVAETNCTVLTLSKKKFDELVNKCPRLLMCFSQILSPL